MVEIVAILCIPVTCVAFAMAFRMFFADLARAHHEDIACIMRHLEDTQQIGGTPMAAVKADRAIQEKDMEKKYEAAKHEKELHFQWQLHRLGHSMKESDPELEIVGARRRRDVDEETQRKAFGD